MVDIILFIIYQMVLLNQRFMNNKIDTFIQATKFDEYPWVHEKYGPALAVTFQFFSGGIKVRTRQVEAMCI